MRELSPLFGTGTLELGTHYHCTPTSHTRDTVRRVDLFITISPSITHMLPDRAAILDFAKGVFFGENRVSRSKKGLKKERRPIVNRQPLYQLSLLPHFLPHSSTVTLPMNYYNVLKKTDGLHNVKIDKILVDNY